MVASGLKPVQVEPKGIEGPYSGIVGRKLSHLYRVNNVPGLFCYSCFMQVIVFGL